VTTKPKNFGGRKREKGATIVGKEREIAFSVLGDIYQEKVTVAVVVNHPK